MLPPAQLGVFLGRLWIPDLSQQLIDFEPVIAASQAVARPSDWPSWENVRSASETGYMSLLDILLGTVPPRRQRKSSFPNCLGRLGKQLSRENRNQI